MAMIICAVIGAAPVTASRNEDRSYVSRSGWLRIVWKMAGGPGSIVMRSSATRRMTEGTSKIGCGTSVAPFNKQARMPAFNPKEWKNGLMTR